MSDEIEVGATQVRVARVRPKESTTIAYHKRRANLLIAEAKALETTERQCKRIKRDGNRCKRWAIKGGVVCPFHGGSAPQVKAKAQRRLNAMAEPAIIRLEALVHQNEHLPTALGAIKEVLLRAGDNAIGALAKDTGERDSRPQISVNIALGGLDVAKAGIAVVTNKAMLPMAAAEIVSEDDDGA